MVCMRIRDMGYLCTIRDVNTRFWEASCRCIAELRQKINSIHIDPQNKYDRRCDYALDLIARYVSTCNIELIMGLKPDFPGDGLTLAWEHIPDQ